MQKYPFNLVENGQNGWKQMWKYELWCSIEPNFTATAALDDENSREPKIIWGIRKAHRMQARLGNFDKMWI